MIYEANWSDGALRYRSRYDVPAPDFEADVVLMEQGGEWGRLPHRANVQARIHVGDPVDDSGSWIVPKAKTGEPLFVLWVIALTDDEDWEPYWITLSKLMKHGWADAASGDWKVLLDEETRAQMLVWWDEHGAEVEARVADRPNDAEVERHLTRAGLKFSRERSGGADWSVPAWSLGNNIYLAADDDRERFGILRRDMDGDDEIVELTPGLELQEAIDRAPDYLKGGARYRRPTRR
jgi:hypothetical protein